MSGRKLKLCALARRAGVAAAARRDRRLAMSAALLALAAATTARALGASAGFEGALLRQSLLGIEGARAATTVGGGAFVAFDVTIGLGQRHHIT